jgi:hypothetical protein
MCCTSFNFFLSSSLISAVDRRSFVSEDASISSTVPAFLTKLSKFMFGRTNAQLIRWHRDAIDQLSCKISLLAEQEGTRAAAPSTVCITSQSKLPTTRWMLRAGTRQRKNTCSNPGHSGILRSFVTCSCILRRPLHKVHTRQHLASLLLD